MGPRITERSERDRERQGEPRRIPLFIEPPPPSRAGEDQPAQPTDESRGWCVIDDTVETVIEGF
jgi:hypothetical protein